MESMCRMVDYSCSKCQKFLLRNLCCVSRWGMKPTNFKKLGYPTVCLECYKKVQCRKCKTSFNDVFYDKESKYWKYFGTCETYRAFFEMNDDEVYEESKKSTFSHSNFYPGELVDCRDCMNRVHVESFLKIPEKYPKFIFESSEEGKDFLQKDNEFLSLPNDTLFQIFSFLQYPKNLLLICQISKQIHTMIYFQTNFYWIKSLNIDSRRILCKYKKDLACPDHRVYELINRFRRFPKFTNFGGLQYFNFEGASEKSLLVFFSFLGKNNRKLRQIMGVNLFHQGWFTQFLSFYLCSNQMVDFERLTRCTVSEDFLNLIKPCRNLKQLVLVDDRDKRDNLVKNNLLFGQSEKNNDDENNLNLYTRRASKSDLKKLSQPVEWSHYPYDGEILKLDLSLFPKLERLYVRNSKLRIENLESCQNFYELRLKKVRIDRNLVTSSSLIELKSFHFNDSSFFEKQEKGFVPWNSDPGEENFKAFMESVGEKLEKLVTTSWSHGTDYLIEKCPNLRKLKIKLFPKHHNGIDILKILLELKQLEKLYLGLHQRKELDFGLPTSRSSTPLRPVPNLRKLRLTFWNNVDYFLKFLPLLVNLEELSFHHHCNVNQDYENNQIFKRPEFADIILNHLKKLKDLYFRKMVDGSLPLEFTKKISTHENIRCLMIYNDDKAGHLDFGHLQNVLKLPRLESLHTSFLLKDEILKEQNLSIDEIKRWFQSPEISPSLSILSFSGRAPKQNLFQGGLGGRLKRIVFGNHMNYDNSDLDISEVMGHGVEGVEVTVENFDRVRLFDKHFSRFTCLGSDNRN